MKHSLTNLKYDIENIHRWFDAQESLMEKILDKLDSQEPKSMSHECDVEIPVISNDQDLNNMEEKLINDVKLRNTLV